MEGLTALKQTHFPTLSIREVINTVKTNAKYKEALEKLIQAKLKELEETTVIETAVPLSQKEEEAILKAAGIRTTKREQVVNPEILGGFIIRKGSKELNYSLYKSLQILQTLP